MRFEASDGSFPGCGRLHLQALREAVPAHALATVVEEKLVGSARTDRQPVKQDRPGLPPLRQLAVTPALPGHPDRA